MLHAPDLCHATYVMGYVNDNTYCMTQCILHIGVGRFRILGGPRFRILGGGGGARGGQIPSRHMTS